MKDVNIKTLYAFVEVAQQGHFGRAAEKLGMTQSGLSQLIKNLENSIGSNLVARTTRSVSLTDMGKTFLENARDVIQAHQLADERMARAMTGEQGSVRLGFVSSAALGIVPHLVAGLQEKMPGVKLLLTEMTSKEQLSRLISGDIDVGVIREVNYAKGLVISPLFQEGLILAVPSSHRLASRKRVSLSDLRDEEFIMFPRTEVSYLHAHIHKLFGTAGFVPNVVQEAVQFATILGLVSCNAGIAVVPKSVSSIGLRNLEFLAIQEKEATSRLYVARRVDEKASPAQKNLVDAASSLFEGYRQNF